MSAEDALMILHGLILNERVYKFVLRFESGSESGGLAFEFYRFEVYEYGF